MLLWTVLFAIAPCAAEVSVDIRRSLPMVATCTNVITSTAPTITAYGPVPLNGTFYYCTNAQGSIYTTNTFKASLHTAQPGNRLKLTLTQWYTETGYDKGTVFLAGAGVTPTATASCQLSGTGAGGIALFSGGTAGLYSGTPAGSPVYSAYGGGVGLCFFSDSSDQRDGIGYSIAAEACPLGSYCPSDALSPTPCPAGFFCTENALSPTPCPAGTFGASAASVSSSGCLPCAVGAFSSAGASACEAVCPAGFFASPPAACLGCAAGRFNPSSGSTSATACQSCPAGAFSDSGRDSCTSCPSGTYNENTGSNSSSACLKCASGTYSAAVGSVNASVCTSCAPGRFYPGSGGNSSSACVECAAGRYSDSGASVCTSCRAGTFNPSTGSNSSSACLLCPAVRPSLRLLLPRVAFLSLTHSPLSPYVCLQGTYSANSSSACAGCARGSYSPSSGSSACTSCPAGTVNPSTDSNSSSACLQCSAVRAH